MTDTNATAVLIITCPDRQGLVAAVSGFLERHSGNIVHADQHTDSEQRVFLQRVEWELAGFSIPRAKIGDAFRPVAEKFGMTWRLHFSDERPRTAIFVSKEAHCLYDLLARGRMGELRAEFTLVTSNHPDLRPVAERFGVDHVHVPESGEERDERLLHEVENRGVELIVLARYMQIIGPRLVERYRHHLVNIHHSFLPAFAGARPYHQAHARGVKIIGATAHYVNEELDQGPVIQQDVIRVSHRDSVADLIRKGRDLEMLVLARAVDLHLRRRVVVYGNKTVVFD